MKVEAPWKALKTAVLATLALAFLCCGIYPMVVWGLGQVAFPRQANGSWLACHGRIVGSALIGQEFRSQSYFHPRPSAAGSRGYDAAASGGSNLGPLSRKLIDQVRERVEVFRAENGLPPDKKIPADAVTASGSGLDPHISPQNAELQAARVAKARGIPEEAVERLVDRYTEGPQFGFLGERRVNVLELNCALDQASGSSHAGK